MSTTCRLTMFCLVYVAHELRAWLLHFSPVVLYGLLDSNYYQHHLLLAESIYLLLKDDVMDTDIEQSYKLLMHYCFLFSTLWYFFLHYSLFYLFCLHRRQIHVSQCSHATTYTNSGKEVGSSLGTLMLPIWKRKWHNIKAVSWNSKHWETGNTTLSYYLLAQHAIIF